MRRIQKSEVCACCIELEGSCLSPESPEKAAVHQHTRENLNKAEIMSLRTLVGSRKYFVSLLSHQYANSMHTILG